MKDMKLDPKPWVHRCWDDGTCDLYGERTQDKGINSEFEPRREYSQKLEDYEEAGTK